MTIYRRAPPLDNNNICNTLNDATGRADSSRKLGPTPLELAAELRLMMQPVALYRMANPICNKQTDFFFFFLLSLLLLEGRIRAIHE